MNTRNKMLSSALASAALLLTLGGCDDGTTTSGGNGAQSGLGKSAEFAKGVAGDIASRDAQAAGAADAITGAGESINLGELVWSKPGAWQNMGAGAMAQVELSVPGETSYNTRAKFYAGIRGSVADNIMRWSGQMTHAGSPVEPVLSERMLDGIKVTLVSMDGTYADGMFGGGVVNRDLFSFRAAIAEGPQGNVFIKMVGPEEVIEEIESDWLNMVNSMRRK